MAKRTFIIFFSIVLSLYTLINYYIFVSGWNVVINYPAFKTPYLITFLVLSVSFIAGRFLERVFLNKFTSFLVWIGSFWLAAMVYYFLFIVLLDLFRLINLFISFQINPQINLLAGLIISTIVLLFVVIGYFNAIHPRINKINITINKKSSLSSLTIAAASDIHLGTIISKSRLNRIVDKINSINADIVLFPGDIVDEDVGPVIKHNLGEILRKIRSKYGVFGITGNHEYIGGAEKACTYLVEHGIKMLRDEYVKIDDSFYIIGREDRSIRGFTGKLRKPLIDIIEGIDKSLPIIMMDHQPVKLNEAVESGVDLQLSGHTHHGQLFPFNFITKKVYELSRGYIKKGNTQFYVSCGAGTWGPPIRTNNRPEILELRISFKL